jgi:hypothetical protein
MEEIRQATLAAGAGRRWAGKGARGIGALEEEAPAGIGGAETRGFGGFACVARVLVVWVCWRGDYFLAEGVGS